jgi:hypothetical protein
MTRPTTPTASRRRDLARRRLGKGGGAMRWG